MLWACDRDVSLLGCQTNIFQQMTILLPEAYTLNCIWISDLKRKPFICLSFFLFFFVPFSCDTSSWCNLTTCTLHEGIFARIRWKIYAFFRPTLKVDCTMRLLFHSMVGTAESHLCINFCQETNIWYNQSFCFLSWFFLKEFIT
jgi:hypothetical protein